MAEIRTPKKTSGRRLGINYNKIIILPKKRRVNDNYHIKRKRRSIWMKTREIDLK